MNGIVEMMNGHRNRDYRIGTGYTFSAGGGNFMHRPGADGGGGSTEGTLGRVGVIGKGRRARTDGGAATASGSESVL